MEKFTSGNTLYYPGCLTKFVAKDLQRDYERIFQKIGLDYIILRDKELCCGSPVYNAGYDEDFKNLIEKNYHVFKDHGVTKILTNCPACYKVFSKDYPEHYKEWDIKVEHATVVIWEAIKNGKVEVSNENRGKITYHDPCHLGRHSNIYEPPRKILESIGYELVEMVHNRENALCCGGGGGLKTNQPKLSNEIAKIRIKEAKDTGVNKLVTSCPLCYLHLKENSIGIDVLELSEVLVGAIKS